MAGPDKHKLRVHDAAAIAEEERSWTCPTCPKMVDPDDEYAPYCWHCGLYWEDVGNGLFEDA